MDLNSIERIQEYSSLPAEKGVTSDLLMGDDDDNTGHSGTEAGVEMTPIKAQQEGQNLDSSHHPLMALQLAVGTRHDSSNGGIGNMSGARWPNEGRVEFRNIFLKYSSCATPVLR